MSEGLKKIGWITISSAQDGGNIYGERVRKVLSEEFDVELKNLGAKWISKNFKWRYLKPFECALRFLGLGDEKDLWITHSFLDLAFLSLSRIKGKKLALIYHIDTSVFPIFLRTAYFLIEKIFYHNLKKMDAIVTISDYWKNHFLDKDYSNVHKIYCGFQTADFEISEEEVLEFKKKYNLEGKPIIYIGNCQKAKGVAMTYQALKDLDVYLVTSGPERVKIPAPNFHLDRRNYLKLLKASTIAVFMTQFNTGWDMTAQEAMFFKTPVIGTPRGGFKELLEKSGQIICDDPSRLKEKVDHLLANPEEMHSLGEKGYNFVKNFTMERFSEDWLRVIRETL